MDQGHTQDGRRTARGRTWLLGAALLAIAWLGWRAWDDDPVRAPAQGRSTHEAAPPTRTALPGRAPDAPRTSPALAASRDEGHVRLVLTADDATPLASAVHVFLADDEQEASLTVDAREDTLHLVLPDGRSPLRSRDVRAQRDGVALLLDLGQLPADTPWFVGARAVLESGDVLTAASVPVRRGEGQATAVVLGREPRVLGGLRVRARHGGRLLEECAVTVSEVSGMPHGRLRFVGPEPAAVLLPAGVPLRVALSDARGLATLGAPPAQRVTLEYGATREVLFELPDAVRVHIRAETPRGEAVKGGLLLWSEDDAGRLQPVAVGDAFTQSGAWGYAGHLAPGRYVGAFSPDTEWPVRTFRLDLVADRPETLVTLDLAPTADDALVRVRVLEEGGTRRGGERLMFERVVDGVQDLDWGHARTDPSGEAVLRPLRPGTYRIVHFGRQVARTIELVSGRQDIDVVLPAPWVPAGDEAAGRSEDDASAEAAVEADAEADAGTDDGPAATPAEALAVRLVGPDGVVRPLAWVHLRPEGATWWRIARAAPKDTTLFPSLATGPYELWVPTSWSRHPDVADGRASVLVQQGAGLTATTLRLAPR